MCHCLSLWMSFPSLHNWQCERAISQCPFLCFPSGILAPNLHTLCGIPVLHNHVMLLSQNSSSTCAAFAFAHKVLGWPAWSSWMLIQLLFNPLRHFLICCTLVMPSPYTSVSWQWISLQETCFTHKIKTHCKLFHGARFPVLFPLYINFNPLHHFLICCTLVMPSPYTSGSWQWISLQETCFTHKIKTHYRLMFMGPCIILIVE